jgi:hypothetical protein
MQNPSLGYDCALGKEELRPIYNNLFAPHLTHISKPDWGFDTWYAQLDPWNRTIIYASHLKKYLISLGFNKWGDISLMLPGLQMDVVV